MILLVSYDSALYKYDYENHRFSIPLLRRAAPQKDTDCHVSSEWHATNLPVSTSLNSGISSLHLSVAKGHLVWNGHPGGAFRGLGISPVSSILLLALTALGSGTGTAEISAFV